MGVVNFDRKMALLEGQNQKDLKVDESIPYFASITHAITVDDHVVSTVIRVQGASINYVVRRVF